MWLQKDAGLRNASIVAGAKGCGCLVLAKNDFDQYIADKVRLAGARQRRRAADKVRTRLLAKHIDSSVKLLLTAHQQMLTERLTRFDLNGEGLVTASELLGVIFECGLDLENKEELELQALLLGDDEDSSVEAEDQLIISEFFEGTFSGQCICHPNPSICPCFGSIDDIYILRGRYWRPSTEGFGW